MRFLHHRQPRRALAPSPLIVALLATTAYCLLPTASQAQTFFTTDQTIAGGNPINGDFTSIVIGADSAFTPVLNVHADITGGTITDYVSAIYQSVVNISGGTIGKAPGGGVTSEALHVALGSTLNLSGGTILSIIGVGYAYNGTNTTFNMSGGTASYISNQTGGITNITGGSVLPGQGWTRGAVVNQEGGTVNISGGTLDAVSGFGYGGGTINFGGTATANNLYLSKYYGDTTGNVTGGTIGAVEVGDSSVGNFSGGSIGAVGGVTVGGFGVANFTGSGFTASATGTHAFFDENYFQNFIITDYAAAGTLSDGTAFSATVTAGSDFSNDGANLTFNGYGASVAPDVYVQTDQTLNGVYNNVNVGVDETNTIKSSPTATIADGNDTVELFTYGGSVTNMTGGIVRDSIYTYDQSKVNISGGEVGFIGTNDDSAVTISGGTGLYGVSLQGRSTFAVQGNGLVADGTAGRYFDGYNNYTSAGNFHVTGTLTDGNSFDQTIVAGGAAGDASQQNLKAATLAPDLNLTQNGVVNDFYNQVNIGQNADGTVKASIQAQMTDGADVARVNVVSNSALEILGGVVEGYISVASGSSVTVSGGSVHDLQNTGGQATVTGGAVAGVDEYFGNIRIEGGTLGYVNAYSPNATVDVSGGTLDRVGLYSGKGRFTGGDIGTLRVYGYGGGGIADIYGGSFTTIESYYDNGAVNLHGGTFAMDSLINLGKSPFDLFGVGFSITDGVAGTYTAQGQNYTGVWWDVTGTLQSGQPLDTRYFEVNGNLNSPGSLTTTAAAPEPGALAFLLLGLPAFVALRRRSQ